MLFVPVEEGFDKVALLQSIANRLAAPIIDQKEFDRIVNEWPRVGTVGERPERDEYEATGLIDGEELHFLDFAVEWYNVVISELEVVQLPLNP